MFHPQLDVDLPIVHSSLSCSVPVVKLCPSLTAHHLSASAWNMKLVVASPPGGGIRACVVMAHRWIGGGTGGEFTL